jgi:hypothetical protein
MIINQGDVVLFRKNNSLISKAISFITSSSYTHAGIVYSSDDEIITAEAQAKGFVLIKRSKEEFYSLIENRDISILRTRFPLQNIKEHIDMMLGTKYGYLDLLKILIYKLTGRKVFKESTKSVICSEAVARLLYMSNNKIDLSKEFSKPFDLISPDDLNQSKFLISKQ